MTLESTGERHLPDPYSKTPLIKSFELSEQTGLQVYLKLENTQPSGSFKSRGIGHLIRTKLISATGPVQVYSSSGGNAGLAAAVAAATYRVPCTVVVPLGTDAAMARRIEQTGAKLIKQGKTWFDADTHLRELMKEEGKDGVETVYCHPFDDPLVWEGHRTLVLELEEQLGAEPDHIICSVGGGGLFNGVTQGVDEVGWSKVKLLPVEVPGAAALFKSIEAGKPVTLDSIDTIAKSLGAPYASSESFNWAMRNKHRVTPILATDDEAKAACLKYLDAHNQLVEPACGASLAIVLEKHLRERAGLNAGDTVVVVVCGGSNVSLKGDITI